MSFEHKEKKLSLKGTLKARPKKMNLLEMMARIEQRETLEEGRPKTIFQRSAVALENSRRLPVPTREVHHYDMRLVVLPCPILNIKVPMKLTEDTVRYCCSERDCLVTRSRLKFCLLGKRYCERNGGKP